MGAALTPALEPPSSPGPRAPDPGVAAMGCGASMPANGLAPREPGPYPHVKGALPLVPPAPIPRAEIGFAADIAPSLRGRTICAKRYAWICTVARASIVSMCRGEFAAAVGHATRTKSHSAVPNEDRAVWEEVGGCASSHSSVVSWGGRASLVVRRDCGFVRASWSVRRPDFRLCVCTRVQVCQGVSLCTVLDGHKGSTCVDFVQNNLHSAIKRVRCVCFLSKRRIRLPVVAPVPCVCAWCVSGVAARGVAQQPGMELVADDVRNARQALIDGYLECDVVFLKEVRARRCPACFAGPRANTLATRQPKCVQQQGSIASLPMLCSRPRPPPRVPQKTADFGSKESAS